MVCCIRGNNGACRECYQSNPGAGRSFFYSCTNCEKFVSTNIGDKALTSNHLKKPKVTKKKTVEKEKVNLDETDEADEATACETETGSSCPFTADVEDEEAQNNPADVSTSLFPPSTPTLEKNVEEVQKKQDPKDQEPKNPEPESSQEGGDVGDLPAMCSGLQARLPHKKQQQSDAGEEEGGGEEQKRAGGAEEEARGGEGGEEEAAPPGPHQTQPSTQPDRPPNHYTARPN